MLSAATARLVEGYFVLQDAGAHALKGVAAPVQVWQVAGETGARGRLEAATRSTPLVGREQELNLLRTRWEQAREGSGQVVLLSGEPGIGKSRLIQVLLGEVVGEPDARVVALQCSPYHQQSAFYPLRDLLPAETAADPSSSPEQRRSGCCRRCGWPSCARVSG